MEARIPRTPSPAIGLAAAAWILAAAAPARGAEVRFTSAVYSVAETASTLVVELELTAPECSGEARVAESTARIDAVAGGVNPAAPGADFTPLSAAVPLGVSGVPPIRYGRTLRGLVLDDGAFDGFSPETFLLTVTLAGGAVVECDDAQVALTAGAPAVVEILDDEEPPQVAFSRERDRVPEDQGARVYSLIRGGAATGEVRATILSSSRRVTVEPAVIVWGETESGPRDFTSSFADDDVAQGDERARLTLELAGAVAGSPERLVITIVDDDDSFVAFDRGEATVSESLGEATFALRRTGGGGAVEAAVAADSADVEIAPARLAWGAGETGDRPFTVRFANDNREAGDRVATLTFAVVAGEARIGSPERLVLTIADDDAPAGVMVAGGGGQVVFTGSDSQPLQVRVTNAAGEPVEDVTVTWAVVEGDATLIDGAANATNAQGLASNRVRIGTTPDTVRVQATAAGRTVEFTVDVLPSDPVGDALVRACTRDGMIVEENLAGVCRYFFRELQTAEEQAAVIEEIRPEEVSSQANVAQEAPRVQLANVGARLSALRRAGTSPAIQQLALNLGGVSLSPYALANALRPRTASAFDPAAAVDRALAAAAGAVQTDPPPPAAEIDAPGRLGVYVNGSLAVGDRPQTALETGFELETLGLTAGVDYRVKPSLFLGGALGYMSTDTDLDRDGGALDSDGLSLSLYVMRHWDAGLYLQAVAGYGENDHDLVRNVDLTTPFNGKTRYAARGRTDGTQTSLALELGYDAGRGAWTVGGFGRGSWVDSDIDRYRESGDPDGRGFYLEVFEQATESLLGEAGVNVSYAASFSWGVLLPQGRLSVLHEFQDDARDVRARFIEDAEATNVFAIPTDEPDRDYLNLGVGFGAQFRHGVSAFLFYDTDLERDDLDLSTFTVGIRFEL